MRNIVKSFNKIGAKVHFNGAPDGTGVSLNIITKEREEIFEIRADNSIELMTLEVIPKDRHLVLFARQIGPNGDTIDKHHFLCGHDERHFFVAAVERVSTVAEAKASLKPASLRDKEVGISTKKKNRRKTNTFKRQGEWFFVPDQSVGIEKHKIRRNEPLVRGNGSKAHIAQFAYRVGGTAVKVCNRYPNGLTIEEYNALLESEPNASWLNWQEMLRDASVFVRGTIRHPDHATITLNSWHRVLMNTERPRAQGAFEVAFLD